MTAEEKGLALAAIRELRADVGRTITVRKRATFEPWTGPNYPTIDEEIEKSMQEVFHVTVTPELYKEAFG